MDSAGRGRTGRGSELLLSSISAVSWAFIAMTGVAALGLHLLGADAAGSLGPMTAAVVVLAVGGSLTPSGAVEAFGLTGAGAHSTVEITPLGVSLVGALLLGGIFARSLRRAGPVLAARELAARAGTVAVLFLLLVAGLAWAGSDTITFDGLGLGGSGASRQGLPGLGDLGDLGGELPDRLAGLARAKAEVGFTVRTGPSLLHGAVWVLVVLLIVLLTARRAPLPRGWEPLHRGLRPAASALRSVLVLAVGAGLAAALYAAAGDDHPGRVAGAALLGAPNGVWLGVPLGLFVSWHATASGGLVHVLPSPVDELLGGRAEESLTVGRLAGLDAGVWLLTVACVAMMLTAGVLTAVRTPRTGPGALAFAARCALWLGVTGAVAMPLLVLLTRVKADASLSVLGVDAFGAGLELRGDTAMAVVLGAAWGAAAGLLGGLLACAAGAAGRGALAYGPGGAGPSATAGGGGGRTVPERAWPPGVGAPPANPGAAGGRHSPYGGPNPYRTPQPPEGDRTAGTRNPAGPAGAPPANPGAAGGRRPAYGEPDPYRVPQPPEGDRTAGTRNPAGPAGPPPVNPGAADGRHSPYGRPDPSPAGPGAPSSAGPVPYGGPNPCRTPHATEPGQPPDPYRRPSLGAPTRPGRPLPPPPQGHG
ncbi:streptophobe family protein [Streptomyces gamaensis]|uniref:Streptophobe family protein n=1 Tax=Streptomyces gamaensis TaxID=1763542 RepID=A0ABW0Z3V1_9ACTN